MKDLDLDALLMSTLIKSNLPKTYKTHIYLTLIYNYISHSIIRKLSNLDYIYILREKTYCDIYIYIYKVGDMAQVVGADCER